MRKTNKRRHPLDVLPQVGSPSIDPARPRELQPCRTCRFAVYTDGESGWCHRRPPSVFPMHDGRATSYYPPVGLDKTGCGEHEEP
jgi:hypothetical protein